MGAAVIRATSTGSSRTALRWRVRSGNPIMNRFRAILLLIVAAHLVAFQTSEPFYINDETRHVMTGAFFHDLVADGSFQNVKQYATNYYNQYPALGLLVWPPLFHLIEGLWMMLFGLSITSSKLLVLLFLAIACGFLYRIARLTSSTEQSLLTIALFAFSPMVFELSSQVMLEIPTLAFALASIYFFLLYLRSQAVTALAAAAAFAVGCAMTKYDAYYLLVLFPLLMAGPNALQILKRKHVWVVVALSLIAVTPMAYLTVREMGAVHWNTIQASGAGQQSNWIYYLVSVPLQTGWLTLLLALTGLGLCSRRETWQRMRPYLAMIAATYFSFAPVAEQELRHTIYWLPAFAALAVEGFYWLTRNLIEPRRRYVEATFAAIILFTVLLRPTSYVHGYQQAANYILHQSGAQKVFFDGYLNGNFIYQMRRLDPLRQSAIVRGDKVLYHAVSGSKQNGYIEYATSRESILQTLASNTSRFIVVESRSYDEGLAVADKLREILLDTSRFHRVAVFPVDTNVKRLKGLTIEIYEQL